MKRYLVSLLLIISLETCFASHISGGNIELKHLEEDKYELSLNLIIDEDSYFYENVVRVDLFISGTNEHINSYMLPIVFSRQLTDPECHTYNYTLVKFQQIISLTPKEFHNEEGMYFSYTRCCRNYSINNIYSDDPASGVHYAGYAVYYEFFPTKPTGRLYRYNSSPVVNITKPLYASVSKLLIYDFEAYDPNGDSLVYELVAPKNSPSPNPIPDPSPMPYPDVLFRNGFSETNQVPGDPSLTIDPLTGIISLKPNYAGLFAFAIKVHEYSGNIKIGETLFDALIHVTSDESPEPDINTTITIYDESEVQIQTDDLLIFNEENACYFFTISSSSKMEVESFYQPINFPKEYFTYELLEYDEIQNLKKYSLCLNSTAEYTDEINFLISIKDSGCIPQDKNNLIRARIDVNKNKRYTLLINGDTVTSDFIIDMTVHVDSIYSLEAELYQQNNNYLYSFATLPLFDTAQVELQSTTSLIDHMYINRFTFSLPIENYNEDDTNIFKLLYLVIENKPWVSEAVVIPITITISGENIVTSLLSQKNSKNYIYPNPFEDFINLREGVDEISVYNNQGYLIYKGENSNCKISTSSWEKGIYIIVSKKDQRIYIEKGIKN